MADTLDASLKVAAWVLRVLGALGAVAGCASMTATLPGVAASIFAAVGLASSTVAGRALATVAEPLFVASAVVLVIGALGRSRLATLLAAAGSVSAFVGMFVFASGAGMARTGSMGATSPAAETLFYVGAALIVASFATTLVRRRRRSCAPVVAAFAR